MQFSHRVAVLEVEWPIPTSTSTSTSTSIPFPLLSQAAVVPIFSTHYSASQLSCPPRIFHSNPTTKKAPQISLSHVLVLASSSRNSPISACSSLNSSSGGGDTVLFDEDGEDGVEPSLSEELRNEGERIQVEIEKSGKNRRRIRSKIVVDADLQTLWTVLTDYERLPEFIPGLVVSRLILKDDKFARLLQIGEQNLVFGLKFNAKGIVDCYEKDLKILPFGQSRDIEFEMTDGDFELFKGKWSIEQFNAGRFEKVVSLASQECNTTLSYVVEVEPKLWLPVHLVEGRICREIKTNLSCVGREAQKVYHSSHPDY